MSTLLQDLKYGLRMLAKNPGFTAVAVLTLALGISASTAIFSVVDAVLLRSLPYPDAGRLVTVYQNTQKNASGNYNVFSAPNYLAWRDYAQAFDQLAAWTPRSYNLADATHPEHIDGTLVTANIFGLLRVNPILGRTFLPQEDLPGGPKVVLLSYGFWQRHFGGSPAVLGKSLRLDGGGYEVVGVMPRNSQVPESVGQFWVPLQLNPADPNSSARGLHWLFGLARLKAGVTLAQTQAELNNVASVVGRQYPQTDASYGLFLVPLLEDVVGTVRPALEILLAAVGLVLLIACVNVANLLLARAARRQKEIALRSALGAGRGRIARQLLTESGLLSVVGGGAGLLLAFGAVRWLASLAPAGSIPRSDGVAVDGRALAFTLVATLLTGLAFGVFPALQASKCDTNETLKESGRGGDSGYKRTRLRSALVIAEVAVACALLIGAGLTIMSFLRLKNVQLGFDPSNIISLRVSLPASQWPPEHMDEFRQTLMEGAAALPGVRSVALTRNLPLSGTDPSLFVTIVGRPPVPVGQEPIVRARFVSPGYFKMMGIPIRRGRDFTPSDRAGSSGAVIISESMARQYWANENPIGKQLKPGYPSSSLVCNVVGVVGDVRHWLAIEEPPVAYYPYAQIPASFVPLLESYVTLTVKAAGQPQSLVSALQHEIHGIDSDLPVYDVQSMDKMVKDQSASSRFQMLLLGVFGAIGMILSAVGIYGVISYSVSERWHEIGIRMALGAKRIEVLGLVIRQGMTLIVAGIGLGLGLALALSRFLAGILFNVKPNDPATFAAVSVVLATVALFATYIPARRAARVEPVVALRCE